MTGQPHTAQGKAARMPPEAQPSREAHPCPDHSHWQWRERPARADFEREDVSREHTAGSKHIGLTSPVR